MIKKTCPNAGTPSPGLAAERTSPDAGLAGTAAAALRPTTSASTGTNTLQILDRTRHPCLPRHEAPASDQSAHNGQHATGTHEYPSPAERVEAWQARRVAPAHPANYRAPARLDRCAHRPARAA